MDLEGSFWAVIVDGRSERLNQGRPFEWTVKEQTGRCVGRIPRVDLVLTN